MAKDRAAAKIGRMSVAKAHRQEEATVCGETNAAGVFFASRTGATGWLERRLKPTLLKRNFRRGGYFFQVGYEELHFLVARGIVWGAQDGRWMDCGYHVRG